MRPGLLATRTPRWMEPSTIWWCAGGQVPRDGLDSPRPTAADLFKNLPETDKNPGWTEETLQPWLDALNEEKPLPWKQYSRRPLPTPDSHNH